MRTIAQVDAKEKPLQVLQIPIPVDLHTEAKIEAVRRRITLRKLVLVALRHELGHSEEKDHVA